MDVRISKGIKSEGYHPYYNHVILIYVCTLGTGITPMLQLIRHAIRDSGDDIQMALLFANQVCSLPLLPYLKLFLSLFPRRDTHLVRDLNVENLCRSCGSLAFRNFLTNLYVAKDNIRF